MLTICRSDSRLEEGPGFLDFFAWFRQTWIKEEQCQECGKFGNELPSPEEASQELSQSRESLPGLSPKRLETKRREAIWVHRWNELAAWQYAQVRDGIRTLLRSICNKLNVHSNARAWCVPLQEESSSFTQRSALRSGCCKMPSGCPSRGFPWGSTGKCHKSSPSYVVSARQMLLGDSRCFYLSCLLWIQEKYCVLIGDFCRQHICYLYILFSLEQGLVSLFAKSKKGENTLCLLSLSLILITQALVALTDNCCLL